MSTESNMTEGVKTEPVFVSLAPNPGIQAALALSAIVATVTLAAPIQVSVAEFFPDPVLGTLDEIEGASASLHQYVNTTLPDQL